MNRQLRARLLLEEAHVLGVDLADLVAAATGQPTLVTRHRLDCRDRPHLQPIDRRHLPPLLAPRRLRSPPSSSASVTSNPRSTTSSRHRSRPRRSNGGHIVDVAEDGSECRWVRVLAYEPLDRVVFSWDISPYWQLETDPAHASEVEVRFVAESPERTRVELEPRNLERHGQGWEGVHKGVEGDAGWPLYLARYADLLGGGR